MKAIWKDVVIAESNATVIVEGNHYTRPRRSGRSTFNRATRTRFVRGPHDLSLS